jgi:hypothetical protein
VWILSLRRALKYWDEETKQIWWLLLELSSKGKINDFNIENIHYSDWWDASKYLENVSWIKPWESYSIEDIAKAQEKNKWWILSDIFAKDENGNLKYFTNTDNKSYMLNDEWLNKINITEYSGNGKVLNSISKDANTFYDSLLENWYAADTVEQMRKSNVFENLSKRVSTLIPCV